MRRRRYEVTEMYALIDISNQMLEDSDLRYGRRNPRRGDRAEEAAAYAPPRGVGEEVTSGPTYSGFALAGSTIRH